MCVPVWVAAAGAALGAAGAYSSAAGQQQAYRYNADYYGSQADDARARGAMAEQRHRLQVAQFKGSQRAQMAANGLDLTQGSALDILTDTDFLGERDAQIIRANAEREAYGYRSRQQMADFAANNINPAMSAASSLLGSAPTVAAAWYVKH